ncbi:MAG TPA: metalloregulator ArsR/SmtB family transcription factor [Gaiellaceae bacterium]|nr:metalloregulator ArsR/SmtB family transcription factor [Gaiellaceae bacterium]
MPKIEPVDEALRALADPGRRRILTLVRTEERTAGEIAAELPVTWPAVSQHLRVLKGAGLIAERRAGTRRYYRARPEGLADVRAFLDGFWDDKLQSLKREVERG